MKARESERGEVTAFLALIFVLLTAFAGSIMESASLQSAKSYRRADMNRAMESVFAEYQRELLEEFEVFALDGGYESGSYSEQRVFDRLSYYGASGMEQRMERIQLLTDANGQAFLEQIAHFIDNKYGLGSLNHLLGSMGQWEGQEEAADRYQQTEESLYEELGGMLNENDLTLPAEDNPLPNIQQLAAAPLAELVMPKERQVSDKSVEKGGLVSHRNLRSGFGDFSDVADEVELSQIAFGEYVLTHFSSATDSGQEGNIGALDYEIEYILSGKDSDRENLESVLKKLLAFRVVPNYIYLQGDGAKRAEAQALAVTLCTVMAFPAAAEALTQVLLLAWAFGESIMDLRSLMRGYGVPLTKNGESWQLSLSGLMSLGSQESGQEGADTQGGMKYEEYLRVLLFLNYKQEMPFRVLDLVELCLRQEKGLTWFRADDCISRMEVASNVSLRRGITYRFHTYYGYR